MLSEPIPLVKARPSIGVWSLTGPKWPRDTSLVRFSTPARCGALWLLLVVGAPGIVAADQPRRAAALYRRAIQAETSGGIDSRRKAMEYLEQATLCAPDTVAYQMELARLYLGMGFLGLARHRYERAAELNPYLAEAHLGQGHLWRKEYLKYLETRALDRSVHEFQIASRLSPAHGEAWLNLVPLLVEQHRVALAVEAAEHAMEADGTNPECLLAWAHTSFRAGNVAQADSVFREVIPRLSIAARTRFLDIAPLASERDTADLRRLPERGKQAFLARFWKDHDPDLASPENEAQLEYWSRVTQAYFLYFNPRRQEWDQRGEIYVRYGPPKIVAYNPIGAPLRFQMGRYGNFPMNVLVWGYPELGMTVSMHDRLLTGHYLQPFSVIENVDPVPNPDSLAHHDENLATAGGRGVFPVLPPGAKPLPISSIAGRFIGDRGPRLLGWVEGPGVPSDSLWAEWVVLDSARTEVAHVRRIMTASGCDVSELRAAEFAVDLPPGDYFAGVSVRGAGGLRATHRGVVHVERPEAVLQLSDLVVACGAPLTVLDANGAPSVRLAANAFARVVGNDPLTAYFEAYHLFTDRNGQAKMEFEYVVRSTDRDPRIWLKRVFAPRPRVPDISAHREEQQLGSIRRQFVSVPVQSLPPGNYQLEIRVRDLLLGSEVTRTADFTKVSAAGS